MKGIIRFSLFIMILWSLFAIFGCNTTKNEMGKANNMIFMGESEHWLATYTVKNEKDNKFTRILDIRRKEANTDQGIIEYTLFKNGERESGTGEAGSRLEQHFDRKVGFSGGENNMFPSTEHWRRRLCYIG